MMRLDRFLAEMGEGTRQEVKKIIRQGRVEIDGTCVTRPEQKVDEQRQQVFLDGRAVAYRKYEYYMLNKPAGVISAAADSRERTVVDLIGQKKRRDLFPVGRLDRDTEGLLLITNDGALAHRLLAPGKHVDKCYYARVRGVVTESDAAAFAAGVDIGAGEEEERTMPARLEILESAPVSEIRLTIQEGKYHQVKRMFQAVGKEVLYLKRLSMGSLRLDTSLEPGAYRELTDEEREQL